MSSKDKFIATLTTTLALAWPVAGISPLSKSHASSLETEKSSIAKESARTLYPFPSLTIRDTWTTSRWNTPGTANVVELRYLTPLKFWNQDTLLRIVIPYRTSFQGATGVGDVRVFDLITFKDSWGFWGIGPTVNVRTPSPLVPDTLQAGVSAGIVISPNQRIGLGLLNQNIFSENAAVTTIQPILAYQLNPILSVGLGELPFAYDWRGGRFIFTPVGFQVGANFNASGQMLRTFINPQFNTKEIRGLSQWTLTYGISFLESKRENQKPL